MSQDTKRVAISGVNGVKVFSATMVRDRETLGEKVTEWIRSRPELELVDVVVTQSSDEQFHCIAITVFYRETVAKVPNGTKRLPTTEAR